MTIEQETFYNNINAFTDKLFEGKTDIDTMIDFIMNYKEGLATATIDKAEEIAELYTTEILPNILVLIDLVRKDLREEFSAIPEEDTEQEIVSES